MLTTKTVKVLSFDAKCLWLGGQAETLRHTVHAPTRERTAEFDKRVFDMIEVERTVSTIAKGVYLSGGTINMAGLRFEDEPVDSISR